MIYDYKAWLDDYTWYCELIDELDALGAPKEIPEERYGPHFAEKYDPPAFAQFCRVRFTAAMRYLDAHLDQLNIDKAAVVGADTALVSRSLMTALYRIYAKCPDDMLSHDYPVDLVLDMAKEDQDIKAKD